MNSHVANKAFILVLIAASLVACQSIPEWDKVMTETPVEDGRCPDLSGRFNYEHLGAKDTSEFDSIIGNNLPEILPTDRPSHSVYGGAPYHSARIFNKIHKGKLDPYSGTIIVTLTRTDQASRKYHVRVDWDIEGLLGEYDSVFDDTWLCSRGNLFRFARTTLHEDASPREIDSKDYRRIYLLPNGNIRIDRKHTFIPKYLEKHGEVFRYYESRVFARVP